MTGWDKANIKSAGMTYKTFWKSKSRKYNVYFIFKKKKTVNFRSDCAVDHPFKKCDKNEYIYKGNFSVVMTEKVG